MSFRAGFIGLIGQPNAGKSTLLNALVKEKVSIVTAKPQTTRRRVLGVLSDEKSQIVIVDAPGVLRAADGLNHFLQKEAEDVISSCDALIAVISVDEKKSEDVERILSMVTKGRKPFFVVVTHADMVDKLHRITTIRQMVSAIDPKIPVIEFSSKWGKDLELVRMQIIDAARERIPESPAPLYDSEIFTPHSMRELTSEIIREKCFEELDKEIPYNLAVRVVQYDETNPNLPRIHADVIVTKDSHKAIVVGKKAAVIKKIGMTSRAEIEKLVGTKVFLKLEVVVRENWAFNQQLMKDLGYAIGKD